MLKLELEISEMDYESLLTALLPMMKDRMRNSGNPLGMLLSNGMPTSMAKKVISSVPPAQLDALIADTINANGPRAMAKIEEKAKEHQVNVKLSSIHAEAK